MTILSIVEPRPAAKSDWGLAMLGWLMIVAVLLSAGGVASAEERSTDQILRSYQAKLGQAQDHFGFAWALNNLNDIDPAEFSSETGAIADRLAAAIRDSAQSSSDPGIGACLPNWCSTVLSGAAFANQWKTFQTWPQPAIAFASAPVSVSAGSPSPPITVQLPSAASAPVMLTLSWGTTTRPRVPTRGWPGCKVSSARTRAWHGSASCRATQPARWQACARR